MSDGPNEIGNSADLPELAQDEFDVELEGILDDLDASESGEEGDFSLGNSNGESTAASTAPAPPVVAPPVVSPPPLKPPPIKKKASQEWTGRTRFEELFVPDAAPLPSSRGGLEEKVEFLREKLSLSIPMANLKKNTFTKRVSLMVLLKNIKKKVNPLSN